MAADSDAPKPSDDPCENTPLLHLTGSLDASKAPPVYRVLFTAFLVSLAFSVTQVPLIYIFGVFTCDEYYKTHPGPHDCRIHEIEASTARAVALLGAGTTVFGVFNLFFTGWCIKAFGVKRALLLTVFFPAVRLVVQNVGVECGSGLGIIIIEASQVITVVGGPVGYLLALSSFATEIVEAPERTATLGRLSGCGMMGTSLGFLTGGYLGDVFSIAAPFRLTLALFVVSFLYILLFLPDIKNAEVENRAAKSLSGFLDPLRMFTPQRWTLINGKIQVQYGVLLLGIGTFLGVLSYSYVPTLLQMYSTDVFDFGTRENGILISLNSLVRGLFLTFAFPTIISRGRTWLNHRTVSTLPSTEESGDPASQESFAQITAIVPNSMDDESEPILPPKLTVAENESYAFDLWFTKYSLIAEGLLTGLATFTTHGYQLYLLAVILPLASGSGPSAKGSILQMCPPDQRADALSAISLVELVARLATLGVFGMVFAAFADLGRPNLTFVVNATISLLGFIVLLFTRFPPEGASRTRDVEAEASLQDDCAT